VSNTIRRAGTALLLTVIGIAGTAGGASAAATDPSAVDINPAVAAAPLNSGQPTALGSGRQLTPFAAVQFDSVLTTALYGAALVSQGAFLQTCSVMPPLWRSACSAVASWVFPDLLRLGWPNGRCLEVFTRLGYPPVGVRYVNC
jgi:hypothetical protein